MTLTRFPHGIYAVPIVGGSFGYGWPTDSTIYFVDKRNGSDGNAGTDINIPLKTFERALEICTDYDVIYILDPGTSGSDPATYQGASANWTVRNACDGLAIVGVTSSSVLPTGRPQSPWLSAYAATTPIIKVRAPHVTIENLKIAGAWNMGGSETSGICVVDYSDATDEGYGLNVYNCAFEDINSVGSLGAVSITGQWNCSVVKCSFYNCELGINVTSSGSTTVHTLIEDCYFAARTVAGTGILCDIYVYCQGESNIIIKDIFIAHDVPGATGAMNANITVASGTGIAARIYALDNNGIYRQDGGATATIFASADTNFALCDGWKGANAAVATT